VAHPLRFTGSSPRSREKRDRNFSHGSRVVKDAPEETVMEFIARLKALARNDEGQDLLEYALLVALIALVCVGAITLAGTNVNTIFGNIAAALTT
jgi:pilus assembly protein Flp/PilA